MKKIYLLLVCLVSVALHAQQPITVDAAIEMALKKNFDIRVARSEADISKINNTRGNAGMLPTVSLNGTGSYSYNNVYQKLSSGTVNKYPSQSNINYGANVMLSWTLYDGGKMYVAKKKLEEMQSLGELQYNTRVLQVIYDVVAAYFDIVCQKQQLKSINEIINYNQQRCLISETGFHAGSIPKTEYLQAQIDLNVAKENAINQQYVIRRAERTLNTLLGEESTNTFAVSDSIPLSALPSREAIRQKVELANADLLALKKQIDVANLSVKEARKGYMPTLSVNSEMFLTHNHYSEGTTNTNRTYGMLVGGTLSVPLYDAGETRRKTAVARTELLLAQLNLANARLQINNELENEYNDYENQRQLMLLEKQNTLLVKENLEICLQRLKLGQTNSLEVHQAQESYAQSSSRLINFEYNTKIRETKLRQLISDF
jgi:outer membrane protein